MFEKKTEVGLGEFSLARAAKGCGITQPILALLSHVCTPFSRSLKRFAIVVSCMTRLLSPPLNYPFLPSLFAMLCKPYLAQCLWNPYDMMRNGRRPFSKFVIDSDYLFAPDSPDGRGRRFSCRGGRTGSNGR